VTRETRIRLSILKMFGQRYVQSNPGAKAQVIGFEPRPLLRLTPPTGASDLRVKTFTFIDAVKKLPVDFPPADLERVLRQASSQFPGQLRSLFVVLSDDQARSLTSKTRNPKRVAESSEHEPPSQRHASE